MGNGTAAVLEPTFRGYVGTTTDALILFEACLTGVLHHVPRRPHDRERSQLVRSGSVFIYEENASGIKRWTDGVTWSPSRILGNFLVYRELDKPFPPGEKKRAMKKGTRRPTQPARPGEPYPRPQESNGSAYSPVTPTAGPGVGERTQQSEMERALVGSLVDSYGFKEGGLVKKTMSVTLSGVTHHLVSYYNVDDVLRGHLPAPSMVDSLRYIRPRPELTTKQSFRAPIDDFEHQGGMEETDPSQALYGYRSTMPQGYGMPPPTAGYYTLPPGAAYPHPSQAPLAGYAVGPSGMPPHPSQNPYMPSPATSTDMPPKTEDYSAYRNPPPTNPYAPGFDPMGQQTMSHMPPSMNPAGRPPPAAAYRTPSFSAGRSMDSSASVDPNAPGAQTAYSRASFSLPGAIDGAPPPPPPQQLEPRGSMGQAPFDMAARRDSSAVPPQGSYYNGGDTRPQQPSPQSQHQQAQQQSQQQQGQQQGQQLPPPQQQSPPRPHQQPHHPPQHQTQQSQSQHQQPTHHQSQPHYFVGGGQSAGPQAVYQAGQQPMSAWGAPAPAQPPL